MLVARVALFSVVARAALLSVVARVLSVVASGFRRCGPPVLAGLFCLSGPVRAAPAPPSAIDAAEHRLALARDPAEASAIEAETETLRARAVAPTTAVLLEGSHQALAAGKARDAVADDDSALALQPELGLLWRDRAIARVHSGDLAGAVSDLGAAIDRDHGDVAAWRTLSEIEEIRGNAAAAYAAWQHVMTLDPETAGGAARDDVLKRKALGTPA